MARAQYSDHELWQHSVLVENSPSPILLIGTDGRIMSSNPAADKVISKEIADEVVSSLLSAIEKSTGDPADPESSLQFEQNIGDHLFLFTVVQGGLGDSFYVYGSDVTEFKRVEKELSREQVFSDDVINSLPGTFYVFDQAGRIHRWNDNLETITGYSADEIRGMHPLDFFKDKDRDRVAARIQEVFEKGTATVEAELVAESGKAIPYYFTGLCSVIEESTYVVGAGFDIAELKRGQMVQSALFKISEATNLSGDLRELLRTIHKVLGTLIDTTNFYVALYDETTNLYSFPYNVDQYDGVDFAPEELKKSLTDYVRRSGRALLADEATHRMLEEAGEAELVGTPSKIWLGVPLKTPDAVIGVVAVQSYSDPDTYSEADLDLLTFVSGHIAMAIERKSAEVQKQSLQEKLERAQRMESLGILAGGVAHDLNNMLGPLVGYPELILRQLNEDSPFKERVMRIGKAATDAAEVIQDLLCLARRGRYEMHPVDLNNVIEGYLESPSFAKLASGHPSIDLDLKLDESIAKIQGSLAHLSKVIMNLVFNAFDAMPEGGRLTIETSQHYVDRLPGGYDKVEGGDYVLICVRDTGSGIAPADVEKIFEPYYSRKSMGTSGSGLGLAVVYGIVKDHHGYYDIATSLGDGTEFTVFLPVTQDVPKAAAPMIEAVTGGNESILVVEDVQEQRELASEMLTSLGYRVETVCNGREAVQFLNEHFVEILLLDMIMERDFDGLDTYREIIKRHPRQKAVIVSGFSSTERVEEMQQLGAGAYLRKPYSLGDLGSAIREELDRTESFRATPDIIS